MDLPPRPPPDSEQPPALQGRRPKEGAAVRGVAATIEELSVALALADKHGLSSEEKRKLKKKVCLWFQGLAGGVVRIVCGRGWTGRSFFQSFVDCGIAQC